MLNTIVRQIAMHNFEKAFHERRKEGELTTRQINEIWLRTQRESFGPAVRVGEEYQYFWAYIPHFIHMPFYVYAYAFGECLALALYAHYGKSADGFAEKYIRILAAGGSKQHRPLFSIFDFDLSKPQFWQNGMQILSAFIDRIEEMQ